MKNINIDRENIGSEEIAAGKDFNKLLGQYNAAMPKPWYSSIKVWLGSASVLVATAVVLVMYFNRGTDDTSLQQASVPFINPPVAEANIQFASYVVYADRDTTLHYPTGSCLSIPAGAFMYADGRAATGQVQIQYREFHDAVDILLSGISMYYDTVGDIDHLHSAGMIQFLASQDGKPLVPNPEKLINVDMVSNTADSNYNLYYLDTVQRKWVISTQAMRISTQGQSVEEVYDSVGYNVALEPMYSGLDTSVAISQLPDPQLQQVQTEITEIEQTKPLEPLKADNTKQSFDIDVNPSEFPEIAVYKNVLFELDGDQQMDSKWFKTVWEGVSLQENTKGKNYWVTFTKGSQKIKLLVHPVFDGEDYTKASKVYQQKYAEYQKVLKDKQDKEAKLLAEEKKREAKFAEEQRKAQLAYQKAVTANKKAQDDYAKQVQNYNAAWQKQLASENITDNIYRSFTLNNFGIVNCDQTLQIANKVSFVAKYVDDKGSYLSRNYQTYLVLLQRNTVIANNEQGTFFPGEPCLLLVIDKDMNIWLADTDEFKGIFPNTTRYTFKMKPVADKANIESTLKQFLQPKSNS